MLRPAVAVLGAAVALAVAAPAVGAQQAGTTVRPAGALVEPQFYDRPPPGRAMSAREVLALAAAVPKVRAGGRRADAIEQVLRPGSAP